MARLAITLIKQSKKNINIKVIGSLVLPCLFSVITLSLKEYHFTINYFMLQQDNKNPFICNQGHIIEQLCINNDCLFDAYFCMDDECQYGRRNNHQKCDFVHVNTLEKRIEHRNNIKHNTFQSIFEIQQKIINQLKASKKELSHRQISQQNKRLQTLIKQTTSKQTIKTMKGADINEIINYLSPHLDQQSLQNQLQKYNSYTQLIINELKGFREAIIAALYTDKKIDSKILSKKQQTYLIKQLNNPSAIKLLFRASQHNFSTFKFHQCCDGISNTITIVKNQFGKTIAGYTPLKWNQNKAKFAHDKSMRSFLLQLQLKQKMTLIKPQKAIYNNNNYGPTFGDGHDLHISQSCDKNRESYSSFPCSYNFNQKYQPNQESYFAFCGNKQGYRFKVLQYEVFHVKWEEID